MRYVPQVKTRRSANPARWQGAMIDAQGREIAITPAMIRAACEALEPYSLSGRYAQRLQQLSLRRR